MSHTPKDDVRELQGAVKALQEQIKELDAKLSVQLNDIQSLKALVDNLTNPNNSGSGQPQ